MKLAALSAFALCGLGAGLGLGATWAQTATSQTATSQTAAPPVKMITIKGRKIQAQIGKASDAQGQKVTDALVYALGRRIKGMGKPMQLKVLPGPLASKGRFEEIYLSVKPGKVKKMRISELTLRAKDVRVDVPHLFSEKKVQTLSSKTALRAVVTEGDLTYLLSQGEQSSEMGLTVKFLTNNRFRVAGNWNWTWFSGPVVGIARLQMAPGNKINVDIISLKLNGAEVPAFVKSKFSEKMNPVLDYNDLPFQPRFKSLKVVGNKAFITA